MRVWWREGRYQERAELETTSCSDEKGQHTVTGLAERHVFLMRTAALKTERSCSKKGITVEDVKADPADLGSHLYRHARTINELKSWHNGKHMACH